MRKPYQGIETSLYLMKSYEFLSISHYKTFKEFERNVDKSDSINYYNGLALISLNAGIIEGLLRSILVEKIEKEYDEVSKKNISTSIKSILIKSRNEIETQGGWEKLQEQFSTYFDINLKSVLGNNNFLTLKVLFKLRNIVSHGTAFIEPLNKIENLDKDLYPYKWQTKLQEVNNYCVENFGENSIIKAMGLYKFPIHFFEKTKEIIILLEKDFSNLHPRIDNVFNEIKIVEFGKRKMYNFL